MKSTIVGADQVDPRINFFDQLAPRWDTDCSNPAETLRRLDELETRLNLRPGQHLLEIGCGTGQITSWLARRVHPGRIDRALRENLRRTEIDRDEPRADRREPPAVAAHSRRR